MPTPSWPPDAGSSLPTAVLSLTACLLLALPLLGSIRSAWAAAQGSARLAVEVAASRKADAVLRALARRIRPPWWTSLAPASLRNQEARLRWLDGDRDDEAFLTFTDGLLSIRENGRVAVLITGLEAFSLSLLPQTGPPRGMCARWRAAGRDWECRAAFGALPLSTGEGAP